MSDLRLEELPFEFEGKTYLLRANMNALADVQEVYGGAITDALTDGRPYRSVMEFLAAMMNVSPGRVWAGSSARARCR